MTATVKLKLKPLMVPNFAIVQMRAPANSATSNETGPSIRLNELDEDALEDLAYGWLIDFYKKAGKHCPFYRPAKCEPAR